VRVNSNDRAYGCEPLIYTSGERIRNEVEQAIMPFTTYLPLPPPTSSQLVDELPDVAPEEVTTMP